MPVLWLGGMVGCRHARGRRRPARSMGRSRACSGHGRDQTRTGCSKLDHGTCRSAAAAVLRGMRCHRNRMVYAVPQRASRVAESGAATVGSGSARLCTWTIPRCGPARRARLQGVGAPGSGSALWTLYGRGYRHHGPGDRWGGEFRGGPPAGSGAVATSASRRRGGAHMARVGHRAVSALSEAGRPAALADCLVLSRSTRDSVGLDSAERVRNLSGRVLLRTSQLPPPCSPIVLLDDVITTGATIVSCVRALESAGVRVAAVLALTATAR